MIRLNIREAKTHLSKYLKRVERGETVLLCRHNQPIAEIRRLKQRLKRKRRLGVGKGLIKILPSFFEPLPDEILDAFEGRVRGSTRTSLK